MCNFATKRKINLFINQKLVLMKIFNKFLALAVIMLLGFGWASAEVVENYTVDFNTTISTTPSDFRVAPGWRHIVPQRAGTYTYNSTAGVDDSGTLKCVQYSTSYVDALVTPKLTGSASLQVKVSSSSPYSATFKAYKVVEEDGVFSLGDEIVSKTCSDQTQGFYTYEDYTYTFYWVNVEMANLDNERIALVGNNVYIDNLVVNGSAEIELMSSLTISRDGYTEWVYPNCDSDNNFSVVLPSFKVTNSGECTITAGTEGYNVTFCPQNHPETVLYTYDIPVDLAVGEEHVLPEITFTMSYDDLVAYSTNGNGRLRIDPYENITGTTATGNWYQPNPYLPGMTVKNGNSVLSSGNTTFGAFGMISEDATKTITINSTGAAPLVATLAVPEGFTASATDINLANGETLDVDITLSAATPGIFSGNLIISGEGIDDFILPLSGTVLDSSKFFEDFQNESSASIAPVGWWNMTDVWSKTTNTSSYYPNNYMQSASASTPGKLVTPLLRVTEGEKMTFDGARRSSSTGDDYFIKVYYSTDRAEWTLVKTVPATDMQQSTGNDGKFTTFVVEDIPAGEYYIAFESGYCMLDNVYGFELVPVEHDVVIKSVNIPTTGKQNDDYNASVVLQNLLEQEESCDASFVLGSQAEFTSPVEIAARSTATVNFALVPNVPGTWEAMASFTWDDDYEVATDEVDVTITEETAEKLVEVSDENYPNKSTSSSSPVNLVYENSESMSIYTAAQLGLNVGDKITSLTWRGYKAGDDHTTQVSVWIGSTDATSLTASDYSGSLLPTNGMTEAYNAPYTFVKGGSSSAMIDMLKIDLAEPFVYQGGNLCIVVRSQHISDSYKSVTFESFPYSLTGQCVSHRTDSGDMNDATALAAASYSTSNLPIVTFGVKMEPATVSGIVTDEDGNPLEGVYIEAESVTAEPTGNGAPRLAATAGPVAYQTVTDADGAYTLPIIQTDKQYNITYSLDGYNDEVIENVDLSNGTLTQNVTLTREKFAIEIECGANGTAETNPANEAAAGTEVVVTVTPDNGYAIDQITVIDEDEEEIDLIPGDELNTFTFEMPMGDVTVIVTFKLDEVTGVNDLNAASIQSVKYYNVAGMASDKPFDGMNIVVTRNVDGTVKVQKVMF